MPFPIGPILTAATPLWRLGMWKRGLAPKIRVKARVISFGNITAGGTGKTPAVIERARTEVAAGHKVAILTRGYGTRSSGSVAMSQGGKREVDTDEWLGDEPELIARWVPQVFIGRTPNRIKAARMAVDEYECDTLILDDGFQYLKLERDENIVVIDATNPFGNRRLLPRGILREPLTGLRRATHFILTRCDQVSDCEPLVRRLERFCPGIPIRLTRHAPTTLWRVRDGRRVRLNDLRGAEVEAACAIGNPDGFFRTLRTLGATIVERHPFPDHGTIPTEAFNSDRMVVVTEKDAVRMSSASENVYALGIELMDLEQDGWDWSKQWG
ncbi:MAG: tetraacyldisaccharide 4'-kinase [bacterium]|nr:tetraacyldisaccharide 4'-kinase [bacterium]